MVREEKQFCYGPVVRAGSKISSGSWWQTHFFRGHPSASHSPLAALAGPARRLGAFFQPKHLYPCPSRGSWLPSSANRPCRESCRKGTVPRGLSRKRSPGSLPPCIRSFRPRWARGSEEGGEGSWAQLLPAHQASTGSEEPPWRHAHW